MALKETINHLGSLLCNITNDLQKAAHGNKAASQRVRTGTVKLEKVAKLFRKESIKTEKTMKGTKRPVAKKAGSKVASKAKVKHVVKSKAPVRSKGKAVVKKAKVSVKAKAHKTVARSRAMSFKRPSAKLPVRRAGAR